MELENTIWLIESPVVRVSSFVIPSGFKRMHPKRIQDQREIPIMLSSIITFFRTPRKPMSAKSNFLKGVSHGIRNNYMVNRISGCHGGR